MIDICIPFRTSEWQNIELRYCLKSIAKNLTNYRNIFIIGDHPGFDGDYIHIEATDHGFNNQDNIRRKIEVACNDPRISDNFFFTNDDHIYLNTLDITTLPYYYCGDLELAYRRKRKVGSYKSALENTRLALEAKMLATYHFDIHVPIIYNKRKFVAAMALFDWRSCKWGYCIKSIYCNTLMIQGVQMNDMMIGYPPTETSQVYDSIAGRFVFAFNEIALSDPGGTTAINPIMIEVLDAIVA